MIFKMPKIISLLLLVVGYAVGAPQAEQLFERFLSTIFPKTVRLQRLDPTYIPNFTVEIEGKVENVWKMKGKADFFNGKLTGISKAKRHGECVGLCYSTLEKSYSCTIGFNDLCISYDGYMKFDEILRSKIKGIMYVPLTLVFVEILQDNDKKSDLRNMTFYEIGQLRAQFTGLGPLDRYAYLLENGFKSHFHAVIFHFMSQKLNDSLSQAVIGLDRAFGDRTFRWSSFTRIEPLDSV